MNDSSGSHARRSGPRVDQIPYYDVLIIGGGYAGAATAIHTLRYTQQDPLKLAIVEPRARLGRGIAYDTPLDCHRLNTPAGDMSLRPDDQRHYARWAQKRAAESGRDTDQNMDDNSYTPRGWFGDYVGQELGVAVADAGAEFTHLPRRSGGFPGLASPDARMLHAWDLQIHQPPADADVLIVGTGLTMLDAVLTLEHQNHHGAIHAVSRHGLLPLAHAERTNDSGIDELPTATRLRALMRELRTAAGIAARTSRPWQRSVDAAYYRAQSLWRGLSLVERRRFLRHARSYWDTHRHRVAPEVAQHIHALRDSGRLIIHRGRVGEIHPTIVGLKVTLCSRGRNRTLQVQRVVNGLGFELNPRRGDAPLLQHLLRTGLAQPGPLGLGLRTDSLGRLQAINGRNWSSLFTLGSLRAGQLWETLATREIQDQAVALARHLARLRAWHAA